MMRFLVPSSVYVYSRKNGKDGATSWCLQASHCCTGGWFLQEQSRVVSCVRGHGLVWEEDKELRFLFISGLLYRNEVTHILHRTRNTTYSVTFYVLTEKGSMKVSRVINILDMFFSVGCLSTASWSFHVHEIIFSPYFPNRNRKTIVLICLLLLPGRNSERMDADREHKLMIE